MQDEANDFSVIDWREKPESGNRRLELGGSPSCAKPF